MSIESIVGEFDAGRITREQAIARLKDLTQRSLRDEVALLAYRNVIYGQNWDEEGAGEFAYRCADAFMAARGGE